MTMDSNPQLRTELVETRTTPRSRNRSGSGGLEPHTENTLRFFGQIIADRYRIEKLIARGAMGHVYAGTELDVDRPVAIKVLSVRDDGHDRYRRRFHREASIASRLQHPNIVTVYDYGATGTGDLFIAMERVAGRNLGKLLDEETRLLPLRALAIAIQIVRALRKAHREGVVHRDLKPDNVMVQPDEDGLDFVKVLDFGLVKVFDPKISDLGIPQNDLTRAGAMMGTPAYMAPEQAVGDNVDGRADIYAVGVILFQMITGRVPFQSPSLINLINMHLLTPPPAITRFVPTCPIEIVEIVDRCLKKAPDDRYRSVDELLAHLKLAWRTLTDESFGTDPTLAIVSLSDLGQVREPTLKARILKWITGSCEK